MYTEDALILLSSLLSSTVDVLEVRNNLDGICNLVAVDNFKNVFAAADFWVFIATSWLGEAVSNTDEVIFAAGEWADVCTKAEFSSVTKVIVTAETSTCVNCYIVVNSVFNASNKTNIVVVTCITFLSIHEWVHANCCVAISKCVTVFTNEGVATTGAEWVVTRFRASAGSGEHDVVVIVEFVLNNSTKVAVYERKDGGVNQTSVGEASEGIVSDTDCVKVVGQVDHTEANCNLLLVVVLSQEHFRNDNVAWSHDISLSTCACTCTSVKFFGVTGVAVKGDASGKFCAEPETTIDVVLNNVLSSLSVEKEIGAVLRSIIDCVLVVPVTDGCVASELEAKLFVSSNLVGWVTFFWSEEVTIIDAGGSNFFRAWVSNSCCCAREDCCGCGKCDQDCFCCYFHGIVFCLFGSSVKVFPRDQTSPTKS